MAQINWFPSQHNYICRLQIVLPVKRSITLGINKAEEFHSFQIVSQQVKLWCKARHSFFWLQHKISSVHMHSPTCPSRRWHASTFLSLRHFRNTLKFCSFFSILTVPSINQRCRIILWQLGELICHFLIRAWFQLRMSRILFAAKHYLLAVICWSRGGLSANEKEGKIHRMKHN